jgi:hypothetical protein
LFVITELNEKIIDIQRISLELFVRFRAGDTSHGGVENEEGF